MMKNNFLVKCIAIILFAVSMTTLLLSSACIVFGIGSEAFVSSPKEQVAYKNTFLEKYLFNYEHRINEAYLEYVKYGIKYGANNAVPFQHLSPDFSANILYEIKDEKGNVVYSTIDDSAGDLSVSFERNVSFFIDDFYNETYEEEIRLATVLSNIDGVGEVKTMITRNGSEISGVLVIAEGAENISVMLKLLDATSTVMGVDKSIVEVYQME